eukprot:Stramenopile-MAST_4_protein_2393
MDFSQRVRHPSSRTVWMGGGASKPTLYGVNLHVYDMVRRDSLGALIEDVTGLHALHTGVEIYEAILGTDGDVHPKTGGKEYAFGAGIGVWCQKPKSVPNMEGQAVSYRETICFGTCQLSPRQLKEVIATAKAKWKGEMYNTLQCNCNHFSDALIFTLCQKHIPERINRLANTTSAAIGMIGGFLGGMAGIRVTRDVKHRCEPEIAELPS